MAAKKARRGAAARGGASDGRGAEAVRRAQRLAVARERRERLAQYRKEYAAACAKVKPSRGFDVAGAAEMPLKFAAEGDSWFDYPPQPILLNTGGVITSLKFILDVPILNYAHHGDEVRQMLGVEQRKRIADLFRSERDRPDVFIFSGGGNDIVSDPLVLWLRDRSGNGHPEDALDLERFDHVLGVVMAGYEDLRRLRDEFAPACVLFLHAYDFAYPDGRGVCGVGPWLKPSLDARGWTDPGEARAVVRLLLSRFRERLLEFASQDPSGTVLVETQGLLPEQSQWHNELHPNRAGFKIVAQAFANAITAKFGAVPQGLAATGGPRTLAAAGPGTGTILRPRHGLASFAMHSEDEGTSADMVRTVMEACVPAGGGHGLAAMTAADLDPETAARRYLDEAIANKGVPGLEKPEMGEGFEQDFRRLGTETVELTGTRVVKFRQLVNSIPVYGSLVSVELDEDNALLSLNSSLGEPANVSPITRVSAQGAIDAVAAYPGYQKDLRGIVPRLHYYFDSRAGAWRLVFILEDVAVAKPGGGDTPFWNDYIVDAHNGAVVGELPRTPGMAGADEKAVDELGQSRSVTVDVAGASRVLVDATRNIRTFDFAMQDPQRQERLLPGRGIANPPAWSPGAISAHANAAAVADYLRSTFRRNNIDGAGGPMNSSINCVVRGPGTAGNVWRNAFWNGTQMVYGQDLRGGKLVSLSAYLDIVGHEMFHGVTDMTARLEYASLSGALNESFSDIIGIAVRHAGQADVGAWSWEIGPGWRADGRPLRDMADPARCGQPAHMRDYVPTTGPLSEFNDYGGVHKYSGIHNKAAYLMYTAKDAGKPVFTPDEVAIVFYLSLTQHLSRRSEFSDSRRGTLAAARTYFRKRPAPERAAKVRAINAAFDAVGIV